MKTKRKVKLPDGRIGTVVREFNQPGAEHVVVITEDGARVTCHPIRLQPVVK